MEVVTAAAATGTENSHCVPCSAVSWEACCRSSWFLSSSISFLICAHSASFCASAALAHSRLRLVCASCSSLTPPAPPAAVLRLSFTLIRLARSAYFSVL